MRRALTVALTLFCFVVEARGEALQSLRLILPPHPSPVVENIARVLTRQVQQRCGAKVVTSGKAPLTVELAIEPGIGAEGYKIADGANGTVRIIGNDNRGLLYGVGKFLHTSTYGGQGITPSSWRGVSVPKMPVRGIYLATHFHNYYQDAPVEDVARYVEDLSLWGVNSFLVWFGMEEFNGINDPKAQVVLARLHTLLKLAKDLGLDRASKPPGGSSGTRSSVGIPGVPDTMKEPAIPPCRGGYESQIDNLPIAGSQRLPECA